MKRATGYRLTASEGKAPVAVLTLAHDERHLRRKRLALGDGDAVLVDLPEAVALADGNVLLLDDGSEILIKAVAEPLHAITARDRRHLIELAWHLGNRHLPAQIEADRILILRDHVIMAMVEGLGGTVRAVVEAFAPVRGAYRHAHGGEGRDGDEPHDHGHGGRGHG